MEDFPEEWYEVTREDPIARKLWESTTGLSGVQLEQYLKKIEEGRAKLGKRQRTAREVVSEAKQKVQGADTYKTTMEYHAQLTNEHELANYVSHDMLESDDPVVLDFLKFLGLDPECVEKATIFVENNQPVRINVEQYTIMETRTGSPWRSQ